MELSDRFRSIRHKIEARWQSNGWGENEPTWRLVSESAADVDRFKTLAARALTAYGIGSGSVEPWLLWLDAIMRDKAKSGVDFDRYGSGYSTRGEVMPPHEWKRLFDVVEASACYCEKLGTVSEVRQQSAPAKAKRRKQAASATTKRRRKEIVNKFCEKHGMNIAELATDQEMKSPDAIYGMIRGDTKRFARWKEDRLLKRMNVPRSRWDRK